MADGDRLTEKLPEALYEVKSVLNLNRWTPIVLNHGREHSPLVALCNVLLLQDKIHLPLDSYEITQTALISLLGMRLVEMLDDIVNDQDGQNFNNEPFEMLPKLASGIDFNPRFHRIDDFEDTLEVQIFRFLGVKLYHGWIIHPQDTETSNAIGSNSYCTLLTQIRLLEESVNAKEEKQKTTLEECVASLSRAKLLHESQELDQKNQKARRDNEEGYELTQPIILSMKSPWKSSEVETDLKNFTVEGSPRSSPSPKADSPSFKGQSVLMGNIGANTTVKGAGHINEAEESKLTRKHIQSKLSISGEDGILIHKFLSDNAVQLTAHGLLCLKEGLKDHQLCVFYWNMQFRTMRKVDDDLYLLCTGEDLNVENPWEKYTKVISVRGGKVYPVWKEQYYVHDLLDYMANLNNTPTLDSDEKQARDLQRQELDRLFLGTKEDWSVYSQKKDT